MGRQIEPLETGSIKVKVRLNQQLNPMQKTLNRGNTEMGPGDNDYELNGGKSLDDIKERRG